MLRKLIAILLVLVVSGWAFTGCKDKEDAQDGEPKTRAEYRQEAEKEITEENAEEELDKIEKEVDAE